MKRKENGFTGQAGQGRQTSGIAPVKYAMLVITSISQDEDKITEDIIGNQVEILSLMFLFCNWRYRNCN